MRDEPSGRGSGGSGGSSSEGAAGAPLFDLLAGPSSDAEPSGPVTLDHGAWPEARRAARRAVAAPGPVERVVLRAALGRTLAEPLTALTDLPAFDTSAMDGWAVAGPGPWGLTGRLLAGGSCSPLADGTAVEIATGAQLPPGATGVLRREHGRAEGGQLHGRGEVAPGQDVRPRGQECRLGEPLLAVGTVVTPAVLGLAAAGGYDRLAVHRRPTVEVLLLGDELLDEGLPAPGMVRDALGPLLPPWLAAAGAELTGCRRIGDELGLLRDAIRHSPADLVVTTGGTAAGPVDFLHEALAAVGAHLVVDGVAVRPGHPMLLAALPDGRHLVGLPGNPLAAVAGLLTLALPVLHARSGRPAAALRRAPVAAALPGHPADTRLLPVHHTEAGLRALPFDGPAMLRGLALADALAVVPPGGLPPGALAEVLPLPS
ncbi:molybdopterin molybdotransferase MoeA [Kitasatospora sp. NPDC096147]|uniref:molybdopterin molybdotransferase MoeA n=1 Tax=Kitasatospora sp. NPDC096147 TaxID=3364093 RepID=UPI00381E956D